MPLRTFPIEPGKHQRKLKWLRWTTKLLPNEQMDRSVKVLTARWWEIFLRIPDPYLITRRGHAPAGSAANPLYVLVHCLQRKWTMCKRCRLLQPFDLVFSGKRSAVCESSGRNHPYNMTPQARLAFVYRKGTLFRIRSQKMRSGAFQIDGYVEELSDPENRPFVHFFHTNTRGAAVQTRPNNCQICCKYQTKSQIRRFLARGALRGSMQWKDRHL